MKRTIRNRRDRKPYVLLTIEITDGEQEYTTHSLQRTASASKLRAYLADFFGGGGSWDGDTRYSEGGARAAVIKGVQRITRDESLTLDRLGVA